MYTHPGLLSVCWLAGGGGEGPRGWTAGLWAGPGLPRDCRPRREEEMMKRGWWGREGGRPVVMVWLIWPGRVPCFPSLSLFLYTGPELPNLKPKSINCAAGGFLTPSLFNIAEGTPHFQKREPLLLKYYNFGIPGTPPHPLPSVVLILPAPVCFRFGRDEWSSRSWIRDRPVLLRSNRRPYPTQPCSGQTCSLTDQGGWLMTGELMGGQGDLGL